MSRGPIDKFSSCLLPSTNRPNLPGVQVGVKHIVLPASKSTVATWQGGFGFQPCPEAMYRMYLKEYPILNFVADTVVMHKWTVGAEDADRKADEAAVKEVRTSVRVMQRIHCMTGSWNVRMSLAADTQTDPSKGKAGRLLAASLGPAASALPKSCAADSLT